MFKRKEKKEFVTVDEFKKVTSRLENDINRLNKTIKRNCGDCKYGDGGLFVYKCNYPYFYNRKPCHEEKYDIGETRNDEDLCGKHGNHWELVDDVR